MIKKFANVGLILIAMLLFNHCAAEEQNIGDVQSETYTTEPEEADFKTLYSIFTLNVYTYYNLDEYNDKYNTDLKKKYFEKTEEYKDTLEELKRLKTQKLSQEFYLKVTDIHEGYNVNKKRFEIENDLEFYHPQFVFPNLPTITIKGFLDGIFNSYDSYILIPMDESKALEVENTNCSLWVYFKIKRLGRHVIKSRIRSEFFKELFKEKLEEDAFFTYQNRLVIKNNDNGEVLFEKKIVDTKEKIKIQDKDKSSK